MNLQPDWKTEAGELGMFPALVPMTFILTAVPRKPATNLVYVLLSGSLPVGLHMSEDGIISGIPDILAAKEDAEFTVRVTDNLFGIRDRTFSIKISGILVPKFITPPGNLFPSHIMDSVWVDFSIEYDNPYPQNPVTVSIESGKLPGGLEMNSMGRICGYPNPPILSFTESSILVYALNTSEINNAIILSDSYSTNSFVVGRPVIFYGESIFGNILLNVTYYIKSIINNLSFTISQSQGGPTFQLSDGSGYMTVNLPVVSVETPTTKTYTFKLTLTRDDISVDTPPKMIKTSTTSEFNITVKNQNLPHSEGGLGSLEKVRIPAILNSRPRKYDISQDEYQGYYRPTGDTVAIDIGVIKSDEYFAFKVIGHDFEASTIEYDFTTGLPLGLIGDTETGWITGNPHIEEGVTPFTFNVKVNKTQNITKISDNFNFIFTVSNNVLNDVTWITTDDLGTIYNGSQSTFAVIAEASVPLVYAKVFGELPPGLTLMPDGEITGYVAFQPSSRVLPLGHVSTYQFTVEAHSTNHSIVFSEKTFSIHVLQYYRYPTDDIYIKATPSLSDRDLINTLLTDEILIPYDRLYRPTDIYFGKAVNVKYAHLYGIMANRVQDYLAAINTHHYWRNVTLGSLHTAVARNSSGKIIYEVVYSDIIDDLKINEPTESSLFEDVEKNYVYWPVSVNGNKLFYPNSLENMRQKVVTTLGQSPNLRHLPLWMSSQQRNGSTLGYTAAWVICFTKPGYSETIKNNIILSLTSNITETTAKNNVIRGLTTSFYVNMPVTFTGTPSYMHDTETILVGGMVPNKVYYIKEIINTNSFTISETKDGPVFSVLPWISGGSGLQEGSYMTLTKTAWAGSLNTINFTLDRFTVDKSLTYNYASNPPSWSDLPGGIPRPNPIDSKDFHVLFPRKTILPD